MKIEDQYCKRKFAEQNDLVDIEARNCFQIGQITSSVLKCAFGFNHYSTRDKNINKGLCHSNCPRCSNKGNWRYIVQYDKIREF